MNSPIVFFSITQNKDQYDVDFKKINASNTLNIDQIIQEYTFELENAIKKSPEQYFWFHKRWKTSHH